MNCCYRCGRSRVEIPGRSNWTQCRQRLSTSATFLRSCITQALSQEDGSRHLWNVLTCSVSGSVLRSVKSGFETTKKQYWYWSEIAYRVLNVNLIKIWLEVKWERTKHPEPATLQRKMTIFFSSENSIINFKWWTQFTEFLNTLITKIRANNNGST